MIGKGGSHSGGSGVNVSAAALKHQQLTLFFILAIAIAGFAAYFKLGQREDPDFTFRAITVRTLWPGATTAQEASAITLPLYGRIAAGTPIEALRDNSTTIDVPFSLLGKGTHYALEVAGDSMVEAGIMDGDIALIRNSEMAETGDIVVALVDEQEATLKRLRKKGASIALEPANPAYETRIFGPDRVKIQGKLVGLFRRY